MGTLLNRRRYMGGGGNDLPEGYLKNKAYRNTNSVTIIDAEGYCATPYIPISPATRNLSINVGWTGTAYNAILLYKAGDVYYDYFRAGTTMPRTISLSQATVGMRLTFSITNLEQCYVYDNTNGKYLVYQGKVVTT